MDGPIDSRQLQAFIALAHGGSLKAAASELMITESAISHAVRNLEKNLGSKLFRRSGKGLALTASGSLLLRESVQILARMRDIRGRLAAEEETGGTEIRLVAATSFIRIALHDVLEEFRYCFPDVLVHVIAADRDGCIELLGKGEANAAILVNLPSGTPELRGQLLFTDRIQVLMSARHRLARHSSVPVHSLCRETVYIRRQNNFTSRMIENEVARWAFHMRNVVYMESTEALREITKLGLGVTFESQWAFREDWDNDEFAFRPVDGLDLTRRWYFAWPTTTTMDLKMRTLLRLCQQAGLRIAQRTHGFEALAAAG